ncbi:MAG: methyltransferase family protein, partial [Steroidobacteraceae bacterium]
MTSGTPAHVFRHWARAAGGNTMEVHPEGITGAERHMSLGDFYQTFFYATWSAWAILWGVFAINVKHTTRRQAALPRLVNSALLLCSAALLCLPHIPVSGLTVHVLPRPEWRVWAALGAVLTLVGQLFTVWARVHLGRNWSGVAAVKADHELITSGPYRWVRHPIYSGLALAF